MGRSVRPTRTSAFTKCCPTVRSTTLPSAFKSAGKPSVLYFSILKKACLPGTARDGRLFCASMHMEQVPITNIILHHQTFYFKTDCYALQHKYIHLTQLYLHFAKNDNIFATEKHLLASQKPYSMKKKLQPLRIYLSLPFNKSAP